jgi:hypothetical protein
MRFQALRLKIFETSFESLSQSNRRTAGLRLHRRKNKIVSISNSSRPAGSVRRASHRLISSTRCSIETPCREALENLRIVGVPPLTMRTHRCLANWLHIHTSVGIPLGVVRQPKGKRRKLSNVWAAADRGTH